jgi:hypothetical protein
LTYDSDTLGTYFETSDNVDQMQQKLNAKLNVVADTLYIGKIKVLDDTGDAMYSSQLVETIRKFDPPTSSNTISSKIQDKIIETYLGTDKKYALFDRTYIVPNKDLIDTLVNGSTDKYNLFGGNAIWDQNHICNRFTIPQLNTKYSSITVASSSLKEERK